MSFKEAGIGRVPEYWEVTDLRSFLHRITYGFTNPMPDADEGPWKLTAKDVVDGYINYNTARHTSQDAFDNLLTDKSRPNVGDVLLTKDGSIGRVAVVDREGICINQSVALLQPNKKIRPYFLKYLLIAPYYQRVMENDSDGSTIKHIYITRVDKMEVAVPPIEEQDRILQIIKTLDDKIELNRQINQTLEQIAQAIFKSWFVDFEPVKAKIEAKAAGRDPERAAMCAISGKLEHELNQLPPEQYQQLAATAALFPDELVESELGLIPEGWEVGTIADLGEVVCGKTPPTSDPENYGGDVPFITIPDMHGKLVVTSTSKKLSFRGANTQKNKFLRPGSVCVSCIATPGLVTRVTGESQTNQQINSVVPYEKWGEAYPLFALRLIGDLVRSSGAGGSVFHNLSKTGFEQLNITLCDERLAKAFDWALSPILEQITFTQQQSESLATLRDTLLPNLLSGDIDIKKVQSD